MSDPTKTNTGANNEVKAIPTDPTEIELAPTTTSNPANKEQLDTTSAEVIVSTHKFNEPLSLEYATEDTVPLHLCEMLNQLGERKITSAELLVLLIYLVALESGFVEEQTFNEKRHLLKTVPAIGCFHIYNVRLLSKLPVHYTKEFDNTAYQLVLRTLLNQQCCELATLQSRLMAVVLGDLLMVTLSPLPPSKDPGFSVCLSIGRYVLNVQLKPLFKRFRKLDELSLQLRQKLFQPMRAQQLLALKLHGYPSLLGLPAELYDEIFRHLSKNQLNIIANVNWQLCNYSKEFKDRRKQESN